MTFFKNNLLADVNDLLDELATQLVAEGWSQFTANAATGDVGDHHLGREEVFYSNGNADHPGGFWIDFFRVDPVTSGVDVLKWCGWTGQKGPVAITTATLTDIGATGLMTVDTAAPHPFVTGDLVCINGTDNEDCNLACPAGTNNLINSVGTITKTGPSTFTFPWAYDSPTGVGNGGWAWAIYNPVGHRTETNNYYCGLTGIDLALPMTVIGYVDELRICGMIIQGAQRRAFYCGIIDRSEHVQDEAIAVAKLSAPAVGDGINPVILSLDRVVSKLYVTQRIDVVPPDSALPLSGHGGALWRSDVEKTTITTFVGPANSLTAILSANTFPAGSLVGWDPCPLAIYGSVSAANADLCAPGSSNYPMWLPWGTAGLRPSIVTNQFGGSLHNLAPKTNTESTIDPDESLFFHLMRFVAEGAIGVNMTELAKGARGPLVGLYAGPTSVSISDQDLVRCGNPANDPDTMYIYLATPVAATVYGPTIGPEAV